jgi:hypothetical protein
MADDFLLDRLNSFNAKARRHRRGVRAWAARGLRQLRERRRSRITASATPHAPRAQFALPGLLFRNIATTDLYSADWKIVGASITFKARTERLC